MIILSYVNIFARDLQKLAEFYRQLFDFEEIIESRTQYYRGFRCGTASLGISSLEAYELLDLTPMSGLGENNLVTFDVEHPSQILHFVEAAQKLGGTLQKPPFETYYGWYQTIMRDPEGNALRLNYPGKPTS